MLRDLPQSVTLIGPAFMPTGRGEELRCVRRAFDTVGVDAKIRDVSWWRTTGDEALEKDIGKHLVQTLSPYFNIFVINGNEVEWVLNAIGCAQTPPIGYNIVLPQWELSLYPKEWARLLDRFDEVWAPTHFVFNCLRSAVTRPVFHLPMPVQVGLSSFLERRYFGLPEGSFIYMLLFDLASYVDRKNPFSVIKAFRKVCSKRPHADVRLLIKISRHDSGHLMQAFKRFMAEVNGGPYADKIIIVDNILTDNEIKNLIQCSDCYVSLHRSEGFGRGLAEAMYLGKPVVATAYSGNLDFMNDENSFLVDYKLTKVLEGTYLFPGGQVWADPDIDQAASFMLRLFDEPETCSRIGRQASRHIRTYFSNRAVGLKYEERLNAILKDGATAGPAVPPGSTFPY